MDSKRKYLTGGSGPKAHGSKHQEQAAKYGGSAPGGMAQPAAPFAGRPGQGPVPQQLMGRSRTNLPQGYPIGPSSRQAMGSRLGDSSHLSDQIQSLQRFKGSFNPVDNQNNQLASRQHVVQGGQSPGQRTNRSSGAGLYDETNVPITERSNGQAVKSARHQPKTLTQMKPNLLGSEYTQPDEASGYSTGAFKNNTYASNPEQNPYLSRQHLEEQSRQYPSEIHQIHEYRGNQSQSSAYATENQIKFQGDLGDDMQPPNTDDDDSQEDQKEDGGRVIRIKQSPAQERDWARLSEKEDDTPQMLSNHRKQAANINPNAFQSRGAQRKAAQTGNHNMMTFNELSELEISQSQIEIEGQSAKERDSYGDRERRGKNEGRGDAQHVDNSGAANAHALYHPQEHEHRRSKNVADTATMMYSLKSGPKGKVGHSRQRQLQTVADMSGYEGDQDQYRGQSRGRFQGGKIESRKKKKVNQQLVAARNASKKFKDNQPPSSQNSRVPHKKGSVMVPQLQIELNLDDQMVELEQDGSRQAMDKQQTVISGLSGMSALSGISGASALSGAGLQIGEKPAYQSIPQNLKPQTQIVDIQVQPSATGQHRSLKNYPTAGNDEPSGSEGYQTRPQHYEDDGLRIEHDPKQMQSEQLQIERATERPGRVSPRLRAPVAVVDISDSAGPSVDRPPDSYNSQTRNLRETFETMDPEQRKQIETQSAVAIQKWVRGHIARTSARKQKEINFRQMRKLRRMLSVAYGKTRTKLIKQLVHVLKESGNLHCDQNYQLWKKYQAHCATIIQRHWRGYSLRFLQIEKFNEKAWQHKQSRLLSALVKGYKTRLLLHPDGYHQGIHRVRMDILRVANQDSGKALIIDVNDRLTLKNLMKRRRLKVIELIRIFNKAYQTQEIILQLLQQKRKLETRDQIRHYSERNAFAADSRMGNSSKTLSDPQSSQKSLKNVSTLLDYGSGNRASNATKKKQPLKSRKSKNVAQSQQIGEEFRGSFQNKAHKLKNPIDKAAAASGELSGSRHAGSSSPVPEIEEGEADSQDEDEVHHTGTLWPSQVNNHQDNKQTNQLSTMWPSAQQSKATEETESGEAKGGFASFWPSVQKDGKKKINKKAVVLVEQDDEDSHESGDVDWLALPVAKPKDDKIQEGEKGFEDADRFRAKNTKKQYAKPSAAEGTEKQPTRSFDDEPVGVHNWHPNPDQERPQVASFGGRGMAGQDVVTAIDDLPIKPLVEPYALDSLAINNQRSSNISEARSTASQGAQKGYDFEKMIEVAMQKFGEAPAVMALEKPDKSEATAGHGAGLLNADNGQDKSQRKDKDDKEIKADDKKKELLQKRKKYDPRAAIKKSKQQHTAEAASTPQPDNLGETADNPMMSSRNAADKLARTPVTKSISDLPEEEHQPGAAPNEEQNTSQLPQQPPRPYLKRKTKAVVVEKGNQYKVEGKARIDCWQKGDKESNGNVIVYGNRRRKRQSLLKKNQESRSKIGWSNEGSLSPGPRRQPGERSTGTSPAPFRMNQQKLNFNQMENENQAMGGGDERYMVGSRDPEYPDMMGGSEAFANQSSMGHANFNDPHQQYTNSLLPAPHLSNHLPVQDLETQFELLHGPNQDQFKLDAPPGQAETPGPSGTSSMDRAAQRLRDKQMADVRKEINSHEFKYSMIPFSAFNNSQEVNLYKPQSKIPFLFKDPIPALHKSADFQHLNQARSLFFKCYSDDLYEAILEDYRAHYVAISNQDLDEDEDGDVEGDEYDEG